MIDHTLLKAEATPAQIERLCDEAIQWGFAAVCVNPVYARLAAAHLAGSPSAPCTVVGFPLGASATRVKRYEAEQALADGATEIDMVLHIGALKTGAVDQVQAEIARCRNLSRWRRTAQGDPGDSAAERRREGGGMPGRPAAGADFVKTSTGLAGGGATVADVQLMRRTVGPAMGVKAAGGIRTLADALAMIEAGATRIGASAGVAILGERPPKGTLMQEPLRSYLADRRVHHSSSPHLRARRRPPAEARRPIQ